MIVNGLPPILPPTNPLPTPTPVRVKLFPKDFGLGVALIFGEALMGTRVFPTFLGDSVASSPSPSINVELRRPDWRLQMAVA